MVKKPPPATISEQVEALLKDQVIEFVKSKYGSFHREAYSEVFTATRPQILNYLRSTYEITEVMCTRPGKREWFYAIPQSIGFQIYEQYERGTRYSHGVVLTKKR